MRNQTVFQAPAITVTVSQATCSLGHLKQMMIKFISYYLLILGLDMIWLMPMDPFGGYQHRRRRGCALLIVVGCAIFITAAICIAQDTCNYTIVLCFALSNNIVFCPIIDGVGFLFFFAAFYTQAWNSTFFA